MPVTRTMNMTAIIKSQIESNKRKSCLFLLSFLKLKSLSLDRIEFLVYLREKVTAGEKKKRGENQFFGKKNLFKCLDYMDMGSWVWDILGFGFDE
jgi:hypothetical protein